MLGYSEMAQSMVKEDDPIGEYVHIIIETGERVATLTGQLLAFSRKQILNVEVINLNETLEALTKMLGRVLEDDFLLHLKKADGLYNIKADLGQIDQLLINLAVNYRDAMPAMPAMPGGKTRY